MNTVSRPEVIILLRWTALFAVGWIIHLLLRARHPRWRVILWRGLLCACAAVPVMQFAAVPILRIPIYPATVESVENVENHSPAATTVISPPKQNAIAQAEAKPVAMMAPVKPSNLTVNRSTSIRWTTWLLLVWGMGAAFAALRLMRVQSRLSHLKKESRLADASLRQHAQEIQAKLCVRRSVAIRVSDLVSSSFLCGLAKPAILLPEKLIHDLSRDEVSALLAHEIAHVRRYDLFWCVAWQWARALFWFHPLVWKIPAAHNLACEQEADRIASGHLEDGGFYRQLLARLALRILALPEVETRLALNANSQIAQRLNHLEQNTKGEWNWKHSVAAIAMVGVLFMAVTGCEFSHAEPALANTPVKFEFKTVHVVVEDENGKPIQGASVKPTGFRVKGVHQPDAYGWRKDFGPAETVVTDADGNAFLKYPVMGIPEEKEYTGALTVLASHPEFSSVFVQTFHIDGTDNPIRMTRGLTLEVSGYFGTENQRVTDIVPIFSQEGVRPEDWQKETNGAITLHKMTPGPHLIQLMGRLPSGEIVYSGTSLFTADPGFPAPLLSFPPAPSDTLLPISKAAFLMKPGIRLEGRIDDQVPRPVRNGRVMISVRPKEFPGLLIIEDFYDFEKIYGQRTFWHSYRPIAEDGSFVFESVPPGEVDVTVLGDGFVSKSIGELHNRVDGVLTASGPDMAIPQAFPLAAPVTKIEVVTESSVTLKLTTTTKSGEPIEGAGAYFYPAAFRMKGMFGYVKKSSEEPFREIPPLPDLVVSGKTDKNGKLVITNLPAEVHGMTVEHPKYQPQIAGPMQDRYTRTKFSPGSTNVLNLVLEPKGVSFIGTAK